MIVVSCALQPRRAAKLRGRGSPTCDRHSFNCDAMFALVPSCSLRHSRGFHRSPPILLALSQPPLRPSPPRASPLLQSDRSRAMSTDADAAAMNDGNAATTASTTRKRPRHFWEGPEPAVRQGSPVSRLYQHALESVFGFLSLRDLGTAMDVSRSWSHAVRVMPCARRRVRCSLAQLSLCRSSALSRHVDTIWNDRTTEMPGEALYTLSMQMPQLTDLRCSVLAFPAIKLILPRRLQTLQLNLSTLVVAAINLIIGSISQLTALVKLELTLPSFLASISFAPLIAVASLRDLELWSALRESQPTERHLDQLRALPQLRRMAVAGLRSESLARLVREPHKLRWQELHKVSPVSTTASAALSSLPSLTSLDTEWCSDIRFLTHLVQLRTLDLHMSRDPWPEAITADAVVTGLSCCPPLTDLKITAPLNNKHLGTLLPRLPLLTKLTFWCMSELDSLSCLSSGPIAHRLSCLNICMCRNAALQSSELRHVWKLTALQSLIIEESFADALSQLDLWLHTPPSTVMPQLTRFTYTAPTDDDDEDDEAEFDEF